MTIYLVVPDEQRFQALVKLTDLPECSLELAETREIVDEYLDTAEKALLSHGSALRLATVANHHFLIYQEQKHPGTLLAFTREHVERLSPESFASEKLGQHTHPLHQEVAKQAPGVLESVLVRQSTLQSRLFKIGDTRFELGLEAVVYRANGRCAGEQLVSLELIQGDQDVLEAIAQYLADEYTLERTHESPLARGLRLTATTDL